jgi:hypothetical protein
MLKMLVWQQGNLLSDKQVEKIVRYRRLSGSDKAGDLDLSMRKAIFKAEVGHPLSQKDFGWIVRFQERGGRIEALENAKRRWFPAGTVPRKAFGPLPRLAAPPPYPNRPTSRATYLPLVLVRVIKQNCYSVFQDISGNYYALQYSGGIVFTNYREGANFWAEGDLRVGARLIRSAGDQTASVIAVSRIGD